MVEEIEKGGRGLNLTYEVRDGIACHSYSNPSPDGRAKTLEGRVVYFADKIAYLNHDIEDAMRAGVLADEEIPGPSNTPWGGPRASGSQRWWRR